MSFTLFILGGLLIALVATAFYNHGSLQRQWEFVFEPWQDDMLSAYVSKSEGEQAALSSSYRRAKVARDSGNHDEAIRLLNVGLKLVDRFTDDWLTLLRATALMSRMADAITPISPLSPWAFHIPALSGLALINACLHHFVVTAGERLRLRCYVLRGCWQIARKRLAKHTGDISSGRNEWVALSMVRDDLSTVREETIRSFRGLLLSLSARPSEAAVAAAAARRG